MMWYVQAFANALHSPLLVHRLVLSRNVWGKSLIICHTSRKAKTKWVSHKKHLGCPCSLEKCNTVCKYRHEEHIRRDTCNLHNKMDGVLIQKLQSRERKKKAKEWDLRMATNGHIIL